MGFVARGVLALLVGAVGGIVCLGIAYNQHASFALEMDRDLPRLVAGVYPVERNGEDTFAWTSARATVSLPGADRTRAWHCLVRVRGARPAPLALPLVRVQVDTNPVSTHQTTNDYQDVTIAVPERPGESGLHLTLVVEPAFVPSPQDRRELGVQIDRLACEPDSVAWPPRDAWMTAGILGGAFGLFLSAIGVGVFTILGATVCFAALLAWALSNGVAPYSPAYLMRVTRIGVSTCIAGAVAAACLESWRRKQFQPAARAALALSAGALILKSAVLLHPAKPLVDALFHAHRFEAVAAGSYFFTQPMPDGVRFPYAIALYVCALPFSYLTSDHVALLKILVATSEMLAGLALYPVVVATWGNPAVGGLAVALFHVVPLPYLVVGNANLTFAFGQSVALVAAAIAAAWPTNRLATSMAAGLVLTSLGFLSHIATFSSLGVALVVMAAFYFLWGETPLRKAGVAIFVSAVLAAVLSVVVYYGHFTEVYQTLARVTGQSTSTSPSPVPAVGGNGEPQSGAAEPQRQGLGARSMRALQLGVRAAGWPLVILAFFGAWRVTVDGWRRRLTLTVMAWLATYVGFVGFSVWTPVEPQFQRYADEFVDRVNYATLPAVVLLAAYGLVWAWRRGASTRVASTALVVAALVMGVRQWASWLQ